jgi:hypothetical protein
MTRTRVATGLTALALLVPATVEAAIPLAKARATAYKAGVAAANKTHGHDPKVMSCTAKTSRRDLCKVKIRYRSGAKTCVLDVTVKYKSAGSTRLTYLYGQTVCS